MQNHPSVEAEIDKRLATEPEIQASDLFYWRSYWILTSDRPVGMGMAAIPFTSIDRYATRYSLRNEEFDDLLDVVMAMDAAHMAASEKNKPKPKK